VVWSRNEHQKNIHYLARTIGINDQSNCGRPDLRLTNGRCPCQIFSRSGFGRKLHGLSLGRCMRKGSVPKFSGHIYMPLRGCACQTHETLEGEEEEVTGHDPSTTRLHMQPNDQPLSSGDMIMELLRNSPEARLFGVINDSIFESTRQAGVETPRQSARNASVIQEIVDQDVPSGQTNGSNSGATHTGLGFYASPQPTSLRGAITRPDQLR
jgi:hypothetical protein